MINRQQVLEALQKMRDASKQRKFTQTVEFVMNFRGIDFKRPEKRIDVDVKLPHSTGKQAEVKPLVFVKDKNFAAQLKDRAKIIMEPEISKLKKKEVENLLSEYALFLAEGQAMITVGKHLGQQLAPKGMMPKPIQPDIAQFDEMLSKASTQMKVSNKKGKFMPVVHIPVGSEKFQDDQLAENILAIHRAVVHTLDAKERAVKSTYVKLTMGPAIKIGEKAGAAKPAAAEKAEKAKAESVEKPEPESAAGTESEKSPAKAPEAEAKGPEAEAKGPEAEAKAPEGEGK